MKKQLSKVLISLLACFAVLMSTTTPSLARPLAETGLVTLVDLGKAEITLNGPYDTSTASFGLPAEWKFDGSARLNLNVTVSFNTTFQDGVERTLGGLLTVSFNRSTIATLPLNAVGTYDIPIDIPMENLISVRNDGLMELKFTLDSGFSCYSSQQMVVIINPSTSATFQYSPQLPDTSLNKFPYPLFQRSVFPDAALVVIPDDATSMELQSAYTVIAGLGNITSESMSFDLVKNSDLTEAQRTNSHLIYVGKSSSLPSLADLAMPLPVENGVFSFADGAQDNGVVAMVNSPWSTRYVAFVVSGNTDNGTLKAAQAVSTGIFQENTSPNLAIVREIQDTSYISNVVTDRTFADLGYKGSEFNSRGVESKSYQFQLPADANSLSTDAYLELSYGHSSLMDYNVSGVVVLLNGQPIGSVRFSEQSAAQAINKSRISIPPSIVLPGTNQIEIRTSMEPLDNCTDPNLKGLWTMVWPDTKLVLPFTSLQSNNQVASDLSQYPTSLVNDSTLATTAVVLSRTDFDSWRSFSRVAAYLGNQSNGSITKLKVLFDDEAVQSDLSLYNLIVIGRPSQLAIMESMNSSLPSPFEAGSDITTSKFIQVTYDVPQDAPIGYLELIQSPWSNDKIVIAALGNTTTGVNWGINALVDGPVRSQLAGDFAVINNTKVQSVDTRLQVPVENSSISSEAVQPIPTSSPSTTTEALQGGRPSWILPVLVGSIILIVLLLIIVTMANYRNSRSR